MSKLPKLSGKEIVKLLVKNFGFEVSRQKGSHAVLRKYSAGKKITTIVPMHKEIKIGTLFGILDLAGINKEEFLNKLKS